METSATSPIFHVGKGPKSVNKPSWTERSISPPPVLPSFPRCPSLRVPPPVDPPSSSSSSSSSPRHPQPLPLSEALLSVSSDPNASYRPHQQMNERYHSSSTLLNPVVKVPAHLYPIVKSFASPGAGRGLAERKEASPEKSWLATSSAAPDFFLHARGDSERKGRGFLPGKGGKGKGRRAFC
ncbi:hypothetical protein Mp_6g02640 [Marchantia polymorpha subsp. ruderalis]|uniref:Uncharacterized protein n=2 Tax=Marchantia polymorpha TaxID=3197 RepID=A0AAF6BMU7_MARPO|nr:hypothetical protein MARPO_0035s0051 [Marchantia polymorpha]BBN13331.1 hypothetical protein Mp_6g02640 [Marchantia polymorpha subsp. ruderalis]|eukprot:PTQ41259.1 hypothetical protein MARPO_0035s0051 [Marchantia polymorpha]